MKIIAAEGKEICEGQADVESAALGYSKAVTFVSRTFPQPLKYPLCPPETWHWAPFLCFHEQTR